MSTYIALLRGINVGGNRMVAMADLRALLTTLGFADARSILQSGNLIFQSAQRKPAGLEHDLETASAKRLAMRTDFFVRTADEWAEIIARNPFRKEAVRDPAHLLVLLFKDAPAATDVRALQSAIAGRETVRADGRHAYVVYPDGTGTSKLTNVLIEKKLGTRATGRNWNTVLRLAAAAGA